ncbi:MAG: hypothetical protein QXV31_00005 [Zestosphaera sp.]
MIFVIKEVADKKTVVTDKTVNVISTTPTIGKGLLRKGFNVYTPPLF